MTDHLDRLLERARLATDFETANAVYVEAHQLWSKAELGTEGLGAIVQALPLAPAPTETAPNPEPPRGRCKCKQCSQEDSEIKP